MRLCLLTALPMFCNLAHRETTKASSPPAESENTHVVSERQFPKTPLSAESPNATRTSSATGALVQEAGKGPPPPASAIVIIRGGRLGDARVESFILDKMEVTVGSYHQCVMQGTCTPAFTEHACKVDITSSADKPVSCITRAQAEEYCHWIGMRLPTALEWEWAARGREEGRPFPWGKAQPTCERANIYYGHSGNEACGLGAAPVGSRPEGASRDGVLDLQGNVSEWTSDTDEYMAVVKGTCFGERSDISEFAPGYREHVEIAVRADSIGFRCASSAVP